MARQGRMMVVAAILAAMMTMTARPACAEEDPQYAYDFGVGVGAVFTNIFYMPVKFVYATLGGITGSFAYVLTGLNFDIAKNIWRPSLGGTYVVTPSMLKGEDPIYFSGVTQPKHEGHSEEDLGTKRDGVAY
ncbi:MAG: hypothetical protein ABIR79_05025 [Candidatus Binatia bacterium]